MKRKHIYSAVDVERLDVALIVQTLAVGCIVAIDVAKTKFVAALATATGEVLKLVKFDHPRQTVAFLGLLKALRGAELEPKVVMEPTGTYGDALRHQCHRLGVPVHMMPPKHTHDFAEVLDGVPSMHDAKAATVLAKLQAIKPAAAWQPESEAQRDLRAWVDQRHPIALTLALHYGHLEAMMASLARVRDRDGCPRKAFVVCSSESVSRATSRERRQARSGEDPSQFQPRTTGPRAYRGDLGCSQGHHGYTDDEGRRAHGVDLILTPGMVRDSAC
jgi:hypothetical protein